EIAERLLEKSVEAKKILEIEVGVVGGEEDGVAADVPNEKLFSTPEDGLKTAAKLGLGERGRYLTALTFGNVHGVYKPGNVKLRPKVLDDIQKVVGEKYGKERPFDLVMHGGSGSTEQEISEALDYGTIKMNIDTDTQYAFTRPAPGARNCSRTTTARRRSTARSATRRPTPPAPGARRPRPGWPPASSRPARTCARPARTRPEPIRAAPRSLTAETLGSCSSQREPRVSRTCDTGAAAISAV